MRNLYRPICIIALIALAPSILIGCGGGSSNNQSNSLTRADFTFTDGNGSQLLPPLNVRTVYRGGFSSTPVKDDGVVTGFNHRDGDFPAGDGALTTLIIDYDGDLKRSRSLVFSRLTTTGTDAPAGTVYDGGNPYQFTIGYTKGDAEIPENNVFYSTNTGTVTVITNDGEYVTLELSNVQLVKNSVSPNDPSAPETVTLNGTVTYKFRDVVSSEDAFPFRAGKNTKLSAPVKKAAKHQE